MTDRLVVTTWLPGDLDDLCELHADAETMRFVGPGRPETREEVHGRLGRYLDEQARQGWTTWRVADRDGSLVGRAGFGGHGGMRELGYTLGRRHWGRGLGTELAVALRDWHRTHPEPTLPKALSAFAAEENHASRRILEKVGFRSVEEREVDGVPCVFYECSPTAPSGARPSSSP